MSRVINIQSADDQHALSSRSDEVLAIVVGNSPTGLDAGTLPVDDLPEFREQFRNVTRINLWALSGCRFVPETADVLETLDVRSCPDLKSIENLPSSLKSLVLENCESLVDLPVSPLPDLRELSLAGCDKVSANTIRSLIENSPQLEVLDLSRCSQLDYLPVRLPKNLRRLELNECTALRSLPEQLPIRLRRLGLRRAESLTSIPRLPDSIDYVDLAFTEKLEELPDFPASQPDAEPEDQRPRTLFLFGSGASEPPASEQGITSQTNVAIDTRDFFEEAELVGRGTVNRCKLLLLGNGSAGKTNLAYRLHPDRDPSENDGPPDRISTHGIQFLDWRNFEAGKEDKPHERKLVNLHMWDFGGQEIYHSTHCMFVSRGSVFLVLWDPDQDGKQPEERYGLQDKWFPLYYWLDYIHTESPQSPRVAVVCSKLGDDWRRRLPEMQQRYLGEAKHYGHLPLFVYDSEKDCGQKQELERWIRNSVFEVVTTQGSVVPTYWEIAQDMVEQWLPKASKPGQAAHKPTAVHSRLTFTDFTNHLTTAINDELAKDVTSRDRDFSRLERHWNDGQFLKERITSRNRYRRVERALRFLTRSGWLYWDPELYEARVIVDQAWALGVVYDTLRRRGPIYKSLKDQKGRFNLADLKQLAWDGRDLSEKDQALMLSFMLSVGVIFECSPRYHDERQFISPNHLPEAGEIDEFSEFDSVGDDQETMVEDESLHRGHWFALLKTLCDQYRENGIYARDACIVRGSTYHWNQRDEPWSTCFRFELNDPDRGIGGRIRVQAIGDEVKERLEKLKNLVESKLPRFEGNISQIVSEAHQEFCPSDNPIKTVFYSYAWDPWNEKVEDFEAPVNAVFDALSPYENRDIRQWRDKATMKAGDYISEFVKNAGNQEVDLFIIFVSEKYWRSWWCMLEFVSIVKCLMRRGKSVEESVLVVEHTTGQIRTAGDIKPIVDHWNGLEIISMSDRDYPENLPPPLMKRDWQALRQMFITELMSGENPLLSDALVRMSWQPDSREELCSWVKEKLGIQ